MRKITDFSHPVQFLIYSGALIGITLLIAAAPTLTTSRPKAPSTEEEKEKARMAFCKTVLDVTKPDNPTCGKYLARLRKEVADEKVELVRRQAAQAAAAQRAVNPGRTLSDEEMINCQVLLKERARDPSSVQTHAKTPTAGGLIDFTATNGFGGPTRGVFHCTTGEVINSN
ncbi:hypothetical protein [Synechococcus sp. CCY 0621]|uniref:hypothetical protein n=1 Tax=Synechococcus sp. CCY 0621 TaxID=2815603 RepID=UPI001C21CB96|nr:hypothetical protein [Synechococcus sp. CCY 0621]